MTVNFVLVHGAWHGAWAWSGLMNELDKLGYAAYAPTIRGHGPGEARSGVTQEDFVGSVVEFVQERDLNDVVLVAHSWGGYVAAPAVAPLADRVAGIVFLNAIVPLDGQSMFDANLPEVTAEYLRLSRESADGSIPLTWERFREGLMQEAPEEVARAIHRLLTPVPLATFEGLPRMSEFLDVDIPRMFVFARNDIAMPQHKWEEFAERIGPHESREVEGDHEGVFLYPDQIARVLADFASRNVREDDAL